MSKAFRSGGVAATAVVVLGVVGGGASTASAQVPPTQDLVVWLRGDAGVETDGSGNVTAWRDQALAGTGAGAQDALPTEGSPSLVASGAGGDPTIRFDGSGEHFTMNNAAGGTGSNLSSLFPTAATIFIVATPNDTQYNLYATRPNDSYFRFGGDNNGYLGVFRTNRIEQYPPNSEGTGNPTTGDHVWQITANTTNYQAFIDTVARTPRDNTGQYNGGEEHKIGVGTVVGPYTGDISEILIYNSDTVNAGEVYSYLNAKYGVVPEPASLGLLGLGGGLLALRRRR